MCLNQGTEGPLNQGTERPLKHETKRSFNQVIKKVPWLRNYKKSLNQENRKAS